MIAYILLYLLIAIYFISLPKIFLKAGRTKNWEGYVPGYNLYVWLKIMKKPWWWLLLMLVPGVNFLMLFVLNVELARTFNQRSTADVLKMVFLPWYFIPVLAFQPQYTYVGPMEFTTVKKTRYREWFDALLFAVIAATIIRTFFLEAFKIPTPSMEKNLLVGDYLFVSKISYGAKLPETPISFPFTHNTMPFFETKSYLEIFTLPHLRLPGLGSVKRNDVVVFNFPAGDSVITDKSDRTYYQVLRDDAWNTYTNMIKNQKRAIDLGTADSMIVYDFAAVQDNYIQQVRKRYALQNKLIWRPVDKRDNYIKRCVALPGDVIEIIDRQLYVNGIVSGNTDSMQFNYKVSAGMILPEAYRGNEPNPEALRFAAKMKEKFDINSSEVMILNGIRGRSNVDNNVFVVPATARKLKFLEQYYGADKIQPYVRKKGHYFNYGSMYDMYDDYRFLPIFPNDIQYDWTEDNFGPLTIPGKGETVAINLQTLPLYRRIIEVYEKNKLEIKNGEIYINGSKSDSYTFQMNYYWLMGDNRQNSADSRFWGFVPEDHVVGKAVLIWFSKDPETGVRWSRILNGIR